MGDDRHRAIESYRVGCRIVFRKNRAFSVQNADIYGAAQVRTHGSITQAKPQKARGGTHGAKLETARICLVGSVAMKLPTGCRMIPKSSSASAPSL